MRFMMLVKANSNYEAGTPPPPELMEAIGKLSDQAVQSGNMIDTGGLLPGARARASRGNVIITDGPYAESKEMVAGYAIMEFPTIEDAYEAGRQFMQLHIDVLGSQYEGEMEIRPMFSGLDMPPNEQQA